MSDFLLHVGATGARLFHPRFLPNPLFACRPDEAQELETVLISRPNLGVTVLANDAAQEFHCEELPRLSFMDRRILIQRRLRQNFPAPSLAACLDSRRGDSGETFVMAHWPSYAPAFAWLRWLDALPNPQEGAILCGEVAAAIACKLVRQRSAWLHGIFATVDGLRYVALRRGLPVLTRLVPLTEQDDKAAIADTLRQVLYQGRQYLARHGWRANDPESLVAIMPALDDEELQFALPETSLVLTPDAAARRLRFEPCANGTELLAAYARKYKRRFCRLVQPEKIRARREHVIARVGWGVATASFVTLMAMSGTEFYDWRLAERGMAALKAQETQIRSSITALEQGLSGTMSPRLRLRQTQTLRLTIQKTMAEPWALIGGLQRALPPQIRLDEFTWQTDGGAGAVANLHLRFRQQAEDKDVAQKEALELYQALTAQLRIALPAMTVTALQAPYALDAAHSFTDTAMLETRPPSSASAVLEIRQP